MKKIKFALGLLGLIGAALAIFFVLSSERALIAHPKGLLAHHELKLITNHLFLMLLIVVPTLLLFYAMSWIYRAKNKKTHDPEHSGGIFGEVMMWIIPCLIIVPMAIITWDSTHKLDPYRPLESEVKPLTIQVVALDWKWLFIYPEQEVATVNFIQFPDRTPIHFDLAADGSPMNSFWIPSLSGQIYAMTGMITQLHIMADGPGEYIGKAAEINGDGYADMIFSVKSSSPSDFEDWIASVKQSPLQLTDQAYEELLKPSMNNPIASYSTVEKNLFHKIVMKYMEHCGKK